MSTKVHTRSNRSASTVKCATIGLFAGAAVVAASRAHAIDLNDVPLFSQVAVPGNVLLSLSVEYPTANSRGYSAAYSSATQYVGYFDSNKCYKYVSGTNVPAAAQNTTVPSGALGSNNYFTPVGATTSTYTCTSTAGAGQWSGNFLNWASMQSLDGFRWAMSGGDRAIDTTSMTIIEKTLQSGQGGFGETADQTLSSSVSGVTPFNWSSISTRLVQGGTGIFITGNNTGSSSGQLDDTSGSGGVPSGYTVYTGQDSYSTGSSGNQASQSTVYWLNIRVQACVTGVSGVTLESNCNSGYTSPKPEGLMQQYAMKLRYSAFGYLNDLNRDGGVMRARMNYIGPQKPVPGSASIANSAAEWDGTTGIYVANPDSTDATNTTTASATAGYSVTIPRSGVINYLNKFGKTGNGSYKARDPLSSLYYASQRYYRNLGNVASYSSLSGAGSTSTMTTWLDGFPVIATWDDPIIYACQSNFILGIGDDNTHMDASLPGSNFSTSGQPAVPAEVTADTTVSVSKATSMVQQLETGSTGGSWSTTGPNGTDKNTNYIAGLAYDLHVNDIRSDLAGTQSVNTFWVDVMEYQKYESKNQLWLAAKYGGFTIPDGFKPYASTNGSSTIPLANWHTSSDVLVASGSGLTGVNTNNATYPSGGDYRPDNYYAGNQAGAMINGLNTAFSSIVSQLNTTYSTSFSTPTPKTTKLGSANYLTDYTPKNWSGTVIGALLTFDASGTPTSTPQWNAQTILDGTAATSRKIITCCTAAGSGLPFEATAVALQSTTLLSRTNYASFSNVPGVAATSQDPVKFTNYLRGDRSNEQANGGPYRTRTHLLGDIVDSNSNPVGPPIAGYFDTYNPGYGAFKQKYKSRKTVVYVGANDGMMHAFDGTLPTGTTACSNCGTELFAYVPSFAYGSTTSAPVSGLASLGNPSFTHHFFVDATPNDFDVDFHNTNDKPSSATDWRTIIVGGLGKGGQGYYALDVTDPSSWTSETALSGKVLWEFTNANLGYSYGDASVVKTAKYGWVVIVPSGYNNADGLGHFFFIDPQTGKLLEDVVTPSGSGSTSAPLNMGNVTAFIPDFTNFTTDAIYAGDIAGNVWRLDVTATSGSYPSPVKIATLANAASTAQPVTTRPLVEVDPNSQKRYVFVGTGRLLADSDVSNTDVQSMYAIIDGTSAAGGFNTSSSLPTGTSFPITRANLVNNSNLLTGIGSSPTAGTLGWYMDLSTAGSGISPRVNVDGAANSGVLAFAANLPSGQACNPTGSGQVYAVNFATGKTAEVTTAGALSSYFATTNPVNSLGFQNENGTVRLVAGDSGGNISNVPAQFQSATGLKRLNWREVPSSQ